MKPIDYIYKNLHCFNLPIFKQLVAESGEEVSESIYDYLMETTWNTNPAFLKQFGLDIERTKEESGGDEDIVVLFEKKGSIDNPFFIIDEYGNVDGDSKLKSIGEWLELVEEVSDDDEIDFYLEINGLGPFRSIQVVSMIDREVGSIAWMISELDSTIALLQIANSICMFGYVENGGESEVFLPINSIKIYTKPVEFASAYTIQWDNSNTSYPNRTDTNVSIGDTIIAPETHYEYMWTYHGNQIFRSNEEFILTPEIAFYAVNDVITMTAISIK